MGKHLTIEDTNKDKPKILLIDTNSGLKNTLLDYLVETLSDTTQIYVLSQKKVQGNIEKISPLSVHLLDHISDDIPYSVIFLDEEKEKKKVLDIIDKLSQRRTKILVLIPYRVDIRFIDVILRLRDEKNVSIGLLGDVFGKSNPSSPISKLIENAFIHKEILLSGNELLSLFPISDVDAAAGIQHILFGMKNKPSVFNLFYEHPQTLISLAHLLKRQEPELSIKFGKTNLGLTDQRTEEQKNRYFKERMGSVPIRPKEAFSGFEKSVNRIYAGIDDASQKSKKKQLDVFSKKQRRGSTVFRVFKYVVFGFVFYILVTFVLFLSSVFFYKQGVSQLISGNIKDASNSFSKSRTLYGLSGPTVNVIVGALPLGESKIQQELSAYDDLSAITPDIILAVKNVTQDNPNLSRQELEKITTGTIGLYFLIQRYDLAEFKKVFTPGQLSQSSKILSLFPVLPSVLGYDTPKKYLLLFQNNDELRPTGGFIGSVGNLTLKDGKITETVIDDVYDLDGQLRGHIEPPYIIRRYLQPDLFLRDSNFAPDFANASTTSALLYDLEKGQKVDGVIALDTNVLKTILSVTGPINLPGNLTVDSKNVAKLLESTIEDNFFPGSRQKKETLNTLLDKITLILSQDKAKQVKLLRSLPILLSQKHILFSFADNKTQKAYLGAGFAGSMQDLRLNKNSLDDFLSVNEANIGVNKANQNVTRRITYSAFLKSGSLGSDLSLEYSNNGGQDYKAYIRIIVPKDAKLISISINGEEQKIIPAVTDPKVYERKNFKPETGLEVDQTQYDDHSSFGFITTIGKNSTQRISVAYDNPEIVPSGGSFTYSLLYIKQPGTETYPLVVQLQTDDSFKVEGKDGDSSPILFDGNVDSDAEFTDKVTQLK